jgi:hypothetical protein
MDCLPVKTKRVLIRIWLLLVQAWDGVGEHRLELVPATISLCGQTHSDSAGRADYNGRQSIRSTR